MGQVYYSCNYCYAMAINKVKKEECFVFKVLASKRGLKMTIDAGMVCIDGSQCILNLQYLEVFEHTMLALYLQYWLSRTLFSAIQLSTPFFYLVFVLHTCISTDSEWYHQNKQNSQYTQYQVTKYRPALQRNFANCPSWALRSRESTLTTVRPSFWRGRFEIPVRWDIRIFSSSPFLPLTRFAKNTSSTFFSITWKLGDLKTKMVAGQWNTWLLLWYTYGRKLLCLITQYEMFM